MTAEEIVKELTRQELEEQWLEMKAELKEAREQDKLDRQELSILKKYTDVERELRRAKGLWTEYPDDMFRQVAIMNEEAGEVTKAVLHYHYEKGSIKDIKTELIQTMAMCMRMLEALKEQSNQEGE